MYYPEPDMWDDNGDRWKISNKLQITTQRGEDQSGKAISQSGQSLYGMRAGIAVARDAESEVWI